MENEAAGRSGKLTRIYTWSRVAIAAVWIYHGLVPKLLYRDWSEMTLLHDLQVDIQLVPALLRLLGCLEIGLGLLVLGMWRFRWPLWATIGLMLGGVLGIALHSPQLLHAAFNPVSLNGLMLVLSIIALSSQPSPGMKP